MIDGARPKVKVEPVRALVFALVSTCWLTNSNDQTDGEQALD